MANSSGICDSFKMELLRGYHAFDTTITRGGTTADSFKGALYNTTATTGPTNTAYTTTGECGATGQYSAGGSALTNGNAVATSGSPSTAYWTPSANLSWTGVTLTTDCMMLYNSTQGNRAVAIFTFGSQTPTSATFTLSMPTNAAATGLLRLT